MPSAQYIDHLHAFRGFAILSVVGAHAWSFMIFWTGGLNVDGLKWLFWFTETLFHGSTIYFAIISGLLFRLVLNSRAWSSFYQSKLGNVILPYIVLSFVITGLYWQYIIQSPDISNTFQDYVNVVLKNLPLGKVDIHFWYIPVLAFLFLITPLLAWLQDKSNVVFIALILLPLVVSRSPFPDFIKPQSFAYFTGAYALGMAMGAHYDNVKAFIAARKLALAVVALVSSILLFLLYVNDYQPGSVYSVRQTLVYIQKVAICLLVLYWLFEREMRLPQWLMSLGTYAFAIFFLHVVFIGLVIQNVREVLNASRSVELVALFGSVNFIVGIIGSMALAYVAKRLLGKHARKIVGA
ncbi:acyltransferase family protein [Thalassotalea euphylliae]|uniref:acyltransferase family protein n=1 Tax=Thalassotalea euphylliae TaxID=1655234 RepID=UPI00362D855E